MGRLSLSDYTLLESAGRDPKEDALFLTTIGPRMPAPLRGLLSWTMDTVVGDPVFARVLRASKMKSTGDLQRWNYLKHQYVSEFKNHVSVHCPSQIRAVCSGLTRASACRSGAIWDSMAFCARRKRCRHSS